MAVITLDELRKDPDFQELTRLVKETSKEAESWLEGQVTSLEGKYGKEASHEQIASLIARWKELEAKIEAEQEVLKDDPKEDRRKNPDLYKSTAMRIFELTKGKKGIKGDEDALGRALARAKAEKEKAEAEKAHPTKASEPEKKSRGIGKFLKTAGLVGAIGFGGWMFGKKDQVNTTPTPENNTTARVVMVTQSGAKGVANTYQAGQSTIRTTTLRQGSQAGVGYAGPNGNTWGITSQDTARRIVTQAMDASSTPIPGDVHAARLTRQTQNLQEAQLNALNAQAADEATAHLRSANRNVVRMDVDNAEARADIAHYNRQAHRDQIGITEDAFSAISHMADDAKRTAEDTNDTLREIRESAKFFGIKIGGRTGR